MLIVDFSPVVRFGLKQLINNSPGFFVCGEAENAHDALETIKVSAPDAVIIDISLKASCGGFDLIKRINNLYPDIPVLVFSMLDESLYAERSLKAGAKGYIMKHAPLEKITEAIHRVLRGEIYVTEKIREKILNKSTSIQHYNLSSSTEILSDREMEVFQLIGQGFGTKRIAETLFLSVRTIDAYRSRIRNKLKLKDGETLLREAIQWVHMV
ncbi:response regulator transcription factor [bacterium]|nr:response regulator transcription factor [bacterium]